MGSPDSPSRRPGAVGQDADARETTVSLLLQLAAERERDVLPELFACTYERLRDMAHGIRGRWSGSASTCTTALIHEAYVKLSDGRSVPWDGRSHFLAVAAKAMRQILTDHARRRVALKRGGGAPHVSLNDSETGLEQRLGAPGGPADLLLELDAALGRLGQVSPRCSDVVECRFHAGFSVKETAEALQISESTVKRDWAFAQAWLYRELGGRP